MEENSRDIENNVCDGWILKIRTGFKYAKTGQFRIKHFSVFGIEVILNYMFSFVYFYDS